MLFPFTPLQFSRIPMKHSLPGSSQGPSTTTCCDLFLLKTLSQRDQGACPKPPCTGQARPRPRAAEKHLISQFSRVEKLMISWFPSSTRSVQVPPQPPPPPSASRVTHSGWAMVRDPTSHLRHPTYVRCNYPAHLRLGSGSQTPQPLPRILHTLPLPRPSREKEVRTAPN